VIPLTRAIPERIRRGYDDALYKLTFTLVTYLANLVSWRERDKDYLTSLRVWMLRCSAFV